MLAKLKPLQQIVFHMLCAVIYGNVELACRLDWACVLVVLCSLRGRLQWGHKFQFEEEFDLYRCMQELPQNSYRLRHAIRAE